MRKYYYSKTSDYNLQDTHWYLRSILFSYLWDMGLPWWLRWWSICLQCGRPRFDPWVGKIPWRRKWQPTPVLLPGKSHGWRILVGYSSWDCKESDMTERLHFHYLSFTYEMSNTKFILLRSPVSCILLSLLSTIPISSSLTS